MLRQFYWDTNKRLEDMEDNQRSRHAQTLESLQLLANKAKQVDERVTEEVQRATLATQHLEDQQRRTFSNVAANVQNLTIGLKKLESDRAKIDQNLATNVADQVRDLGSAVEQLQNQEAKAIDSRAIERKQLLKRLNAQVGQYPYPLRRSSYADTDLPRKPSSMSIPRSSWRIMVTH